VTRLTTNPAEDIDPAFSPDGTKIAFSTDRDGSGQEIYVMDTADVNPADGNGDNPTRLTTEPGGEGPAWSPNGNKIAFAGDRSGLHTIYVMNGADGTQEKALTRKALVAAFPAFSPNGKKIAFRSFHQGDADIYVMKASPEGKNNRPTNITRSSEWGDFQPDWQPISQQP
jgi:TolB protein